MLDVRNVSYSYGSILALKDVSLTILEGEVLCLLGPSGCGKTTLLRAIAGLEAGYTGEIRLFDQNLANVPVHARDFGLMFQDFALFPHMNVANNVAYGLKRRNLLPREIEQRVSDVLNTVGLVGFKDRDVNLLSGGQKQRVALARSLAPNPRLLMLDEPLGSLDAQLREQLMVEIRDIVKEMGLTAIYVTHDQNEAYAISDRIAVMNLGAIEQIDSPRKIYARPATAFVAKFLGLHNVMPIQDLPEILKHDINNAPIASVLIHPRGIYLEKESQSDVALDGVLEQVIFQGDRYQLTIRVGEMLLRASVTSIDESAGEKVDLFIDPEWILPLA